MIHLKTNRILVPKIITKKEYLQDRIKYSTSFSPKEIYGRVFLADKNTTSYILFSTLIYSVRDILNIKKGTIIVADFTNKKETFLFGRLDNPLDVKSLIKIEYDKDAFYNDNILTYANFQKMFSEKDEHILILTNNKKMFEELIEEQGLEDFNYTFVSQQNQNKIYQSIEPILTKEDKIKIFLPAISLFLVVLFLSTIISNSIINSDKEKSKQLYTNAQLNYQQASNILKQKEDSEYYKNSNYYMGLLEKKVYIKDKRWLIH